MILQYLHISLATCGKTDCILQRQCCLINVRSYIEIVSLSPEHFFLQDSFFFFCLLSNCLFPQSKMHYPVQAQHSNCREAKGVHLLSIYKLEDGCGHVGESAEEIIKNQNIKNKLREKLHGSDSICGGKRRGNVLGQALIPTPLPPHMLPGPPTSSSSFCSRLQHLQSLMSQFHRNVARMTHIWLRGELGLSEFVTSGKKEAEW